MSLNKFLKMFVQACDDVYVLHERYLASKLSDKDIKKLVELFQTLHNMAKPD